MATADLVSPSRPSQEEEGVVISLTESARVVLERRYLRKDDQGRVMETAEDMFRRVAQNIASADRLYGASDAEVQRTEEKFFRAMTRMEFLSGMSLRNAGRELQQLSACYVLPIGDSMEEIYTTLKNAAFLHKSGAGIGYDFSPIRANGDVVNTTGGRASGPVSFMKIFNYSSDIIVNKAATRRGGHMGILRVDHPDIEEFIHAKVDNTELNNFNVSVAATDVFMKAVKEGTTYDLINPHNQKVVKSVDAREMFREIARLAWTSAEPGLVFMDRMEAANPTPHVGTITATNQCGEQPLLPYEACNLGSIVLSRCIKTTSSGERKVDYEKLRELVWIGVHFLDNTVDLNSYPLLEIREMNLGNRKIGLGVMGFSDALILLGIPYNSDPAVEFADHIMEFIKEEGYQASEELAKKRGSFKNFSGSRWESAGYTAFRNATVTTIAPNGTTSIFANCSSGIEPIFALAFVRKNILDIGKDEFLEVNPVFEQIAKERWFYSKDLMRKVAERGTLEGLLEVPQEVKEVFVTAHDVSPAWHIRIQAAFQKHTDNAVSKTINMLHDATVEDVRDAFMLAYDTGCKGITIYRDGSREAQVLNRTGNHALTSPAA